jgi:hypothetical protein
MARKTAYLAMSGNSELGIAMQQKVLVEAYNASHTAAPMYEQESVNGDIELF